MKNISNDSKVIIIYKTQSNFIEKDLNVFLRELCVWFLNISRKSPALLRVSRLGLVFVLVFLIVVIKVIFALLGYSTVLSMKCASN